MDEFKEFLKTIPSIKQDVLNGRYTWQQLYEIYVMYGKDDKFWQPYKTSSNLNLNMLIDVIKNIDLNALSNSLASIEKVLNVINTFIDKKEPDNGKKWYDE
ncbi:spore coat protein YlbD [uncultured Thomasclavelia sp.]|uniref:spore coat protein YlbD n=1 Tax=uncultured Thomasclavelia sp. TaxID=3025759 RepID=UPI0025DF2D1E|nr:spore coat protein YlbD [uncultured Thomasclavelia sp.]